LIIFLFLEGDFTGFLFDFLFGVKHQIIIITFKKYINNELIINQNKDYVDANDISILKEMSTIFHLII